MPQAKLPRCADCKRRPARNRVCGACRRAALNREARECAAEIAALGLGGSACRAPLPDLEARIVRLAARAAQGLPLFPRRAGPC